MFEINPSELQNVLPDVRFLAVSGPLWCLVYIMYVHFGALVNTSL